MTIQGQSKTGTIINGTDTHWLFYIGTGYNVTIQDLTLTNAISPDSNIHYDEDGGAICNDGTLLINNCILSNNHAGNGLSEKGAVEGGNGGAIYNTGFLTVKSSTFTGNAAGNGSSGAIGGNGGFGGAIYSDGYLNITDSVISGNTPGNGGIGINENGTDGFGGGIFLYRFSSYNIIGNQILNNTGSGISIGRGHIMGAGVSASTIEVSNLINFNRIYGNTPYGIYYDIVVPNGELTTSGPSVDTNATLNWWGSNAGPNSVGADKTNLVSAYYAPWIVMRFSPTQVLLNGGQTTPLIANFLYDNLGNYHDPVNGHIPDNTPVLFTTSLGQVGSQFITKYTLNGLATALLRAWNAAGEPVWGTAYITATNDGQLLSNSVTMLKVPTANAKSTEKTIGMLNTGLPLAGLILAILALFGGFIVPRRK